MIKTETIMDISLVDFMEGQLKQITSTFHRYMYDRIGWESRMFGLVGPRGVGKSTMILQFIKETFFYNQVRVSFDVISSRTSDLEIDGKTFEVGGKKKGKKQISDAADGLYRQG